jgi:large subunit ribosomal protein L24
MMKQQNEWKKSWKSSEQPQKQRKYRANAPYHHRQKIVSARLAEDVRETVGTKTLPIREGDRVEIMRGDWKDLSGRVEKIDFDNERVYVDGVERERVDGTETQIALAPSNLKLTKLELDDEKRLEKYDVSDDDKQEIQTEDKEPEDTSDEDETDDIENEEDEDNDATDEETEEADEEEQGEN